MLLDEAVPWLFLSVFATGTYESNDPAGLHYLVPEFGNQRHAHEGVAGEQWQGHQFSAVTPPVYFCDERKKARDACPLQMRHNRLFVLGARVNRIPFWLEPEFRIPVLGDWTFIEATAHTDSLRVTLAKTVTYEKCWEACLNARYDPD